MNWKPIFAFLLLDSFLLLICQGNVQVSVHSSTFRIFTSLPEAAKVEKNQIDFFVSMSR